MDDLDGIMIARPPTAARPLLGCTVLLVEDSRYASEAMRLLSLRSGARIRRADTIASAERHLKIYRPSVVVVDLGLPDGCGSRLIEALHLGRPRVGVVLGTSGDPGAEARAVEAGADGFIAKPISSLASFQEAILRHMPPEQQPPGPRVLSKEMVEPDPIAFRDDMAHVASLLEDGGIEAADARLTAYVAQFVAGVARSAGDEALERAAAELGDGGRGGDGAGLARVSEMVRERMGDRQAI